MQWGHRIKRPVAFISLFDRWFVPFRPEIISSSRSVSCLLIERCKIVRSIIRGCGSPSNNGWLDTSDARKEFYRPREIQFGPENIGGSIVVPPLAMKSHARRIVSGRKFRRAISRQPRVWFVRNGRDEASSKNKRKSSTRVSIVGVPIFTPTRREDGPSSPRLWYRRSVRYAIPFYGLLCESIPALFGNSRA